jgi:biotin transport system substrate-specific component
MQMTSALARSRNEAYQWRDHAGIAWKITLAFLVAGLTGLLAQIRIPLPFSPVPITGQTFGVLLAGTLLGKKWGGMSMVVYAALGILGMPWFNGATSGLGATTGYLIGFVLAALFIGSKTDGRRPGFNRTFGVMLFAGICLIYLPGLIWLGLWLNLVKSSPANIPTLIAIGATPFIAGDVLKTALAAAVSKAVSRSA